MKDGKAQGPDGLSAKYYKQVCDILEIPFLKAYNGLQEDVPEHISLFQACKSLIPKEGQNLQECGSYRPISLLNIDFDIFSKIIAQRLAPNSQNLIHMDQVGFIKGREVTDRTTRVIVLIYKNHTEKGETCLISIDDKKAFDKVNWAIMLPSLENRTRRKNVDMD